MRNETPSLLQRAKLKYYGAAGATAGALALSPMAAFAQSAPDVSAIEAEFDVYKAAVVALVIAFAVVLWTIRGAGLLKPR